MLDLSRLAGHSAAPWTLSGAAIENRQYIIAKIFGWAEAKKTEEGKANAALLVAAPELLAELHHARAALAVASEALGYYAGHREHMATGTETLAREALAEIDKYMQS